MTSPYEDIIRHPYPFPTGRPRMSAEDRAAQFSPFAALTGYEASIAETARLTTQQIELSEDARRELNEKLTVLQDQAGTRPSVAVTYFQQDLRKKGGAYVTVRGSFLRVDSVHRVLLLTDDTRIWIPAIIGIESPILK